MENEKLGERLASVETELKNQDNRLSNMEKDKELLYRLTVVSEQQQEMNKNQQIQLNKMDENQQRQLNKMDETFNNININLTKLNMSQDELQNNVKTIGKRVDGIEEDLKVETNKGTISFNEILSKYLLWWIMIPTVIVGAWILFKLGL
ncbi:hypothetical protein FJQ98_16895 [Lysinibacillus agricola]|uniref:Uncharacterized protein n=1 Tax=Lysinibacillus agricola TaxID=2590012 RepID=A0ABX7ALX5_9BACI|nr:MULTISPECIES: hypothetical protein [Lysinibacillus]KOS61400.1 hypothetical protein AN161_17535 [Lysinibacillus sp. FJAT-14222]QQP10921.1 hypothetical protein FJQ98_16895 [Lysinibacillus agricola]